MESEIHDAFVLHGQVIRVRRQSLKAWTKFSTYSHILRVQFRFFFNHVFPLPLNKINFSLLKNFVQIRDSFTTWFYLWVWTSPLETSYSRIFTRWFTTTKCRYRWTSLLVLKPNSAFSAEIAPSTSHFAAKILPHWAPAKLTLTFYRKHRSILRQWKRYNQTLHGIVVCIPWRQ